MGVFQLVSAALAVPVTMVVGPLSRERHRTASAAAGHRRRHGAAFPPFAAVMLHDTNRMPAARLPEYLCQRVAGCPPHPVCATHDSISPLRQCPLDGRGTSLRAIGNQFGKSRQCGRIQAGPPQLGRNLDCACDCALAELGNPPSDQRQAEAGVGGECGPALCVQLGKCRPLADPHRELRRQLRIGDGRQQIIERGETRARRRRRGSRSSCRAHRRCRR